MTSTHHLQDRLSLTHSFPAHLIRQRVSASLLSALSHLRPKPKSALADCWDLSKLRDKDLGQGEIRDQVSLGISLALASTYDKERWCPPSPTSAVSRCRDRSSPRQTFTHPPQPLGTYPTMHYARLDNGWAKGSPVKEKVFLSTETSWSVTRVGIGTR